MLFYLDIFFFFYYYIMTHKIPTIGSRIQVYRGHAKKTSGGLTKSDLMMNKHGRVVSKAKHITAKKEMRLLKHGYATKKGKFGYIKVGSKSKKSRKMNGGNGYKPLGFSSVSGGDNDMPMVGAPVNSSYGLSGGSASHGSAMWAGDKLVGGNKSMQLRRALQKSRSKSKSKGLGVAMRGGCGNAPSIGVASGAASI
jgi:hypothetical protein